MAMWRRKHGPSPAARRARARLEVARRDLAAALADDDSVATVVNELAETLRRHHLGPMIIGALSARAGAGQQGTAASTSARC